VSAISAEEKAKREKLLLDNLFSMPEFLAANTVMLFANLPDEIGTFSLIDKCIAMGKKVFLPVINGDDMTACEFNGDYKIGKYGIKEPVVKQLGVNDSVPEPVDVLLTDREKGPEHFDFILVPGVGFNPNGYRLGRGKGYYDKFLSKQRDLFTVGVCFREQFYLDIPTEPHDIPMRKVIVC
jgi:5-formyltetrahydrofolate cyclo-ligase